MSSLSGNSSGSDELRSRGTCTYHRSIIGVIDEKKRKRMESNRESARRSRMRKQKLADDLTAELNKIKSDNDEIRSTIDVFARRLVEIEAENSVLRAQVSELSQSLESLNEILNGIKNNANCTTDQCIGGGYGLFDVDFMENLWNMMCLYQQPIMASADNMFGC